LVCAVIVDREALLRRELARLLIRPTLWLHDLPVNLEAIERARLTLTATDLFDNSSIKVVEFEELKDGAEAGSTPFTSASVGSTRRNV
jgi:hypothetical protein